MKRSTLTDRSHTIVLLIPSTDRVAFRRLSDDARSGHMRLMVRELRSGQRFAVGRRRWFIGGRDGHVEWRLETDRTGGQQ